MEGLRHFASRTTSPGRLFFVVSLLMVTGLLSSCIEPEEDVESSDKDDREPFIVGGHDAAPTPFFTMILTETTPGKYAPVNCGASLVSNCYALTAAHCAKKDSVDAVYIGVYKPYDTVATNGGAPYYRVDVVKKISHENHNSGTRAHDIALLKLETCVPEDKLDKLEIVQLARPQDNLDEGHMLEVYGFGRTIATSSAKPLTLQEVSVKFIGNNACKKYYGTAIKDDMICAGFEDGKKDSCSGDSGGPLVDNSGSRPKQIGVVSWGEGCAQAGSPGVYASVSAHYDWIKSHICSDSRESNSELCGGTCKDKYSICPSWAASGYCNHQSAGFANWMKENCCNSCKNSSNDQCPTDPRKTKPGVCGCNVADTDSDKDGTADCKDNCPNDPKKTEPGACGCGKVEGTCSDCKDTSTACASWVAYCNHVSLKDWMQKNCCATCKK